MPESAPESALETDVAIVGGGLVGASLALALADGRWRVTLIEPVPPQSAAQPSFDERTTALGNGSQRILATLGVWQPLAAEAAAIREIHVSQAGQLGIAHLRAARLGLNSFGYVATNRNIGRALWQGLEQRRAGGAPLDWRCPARVLGMQHERDAIVLEVRDERGASANVSQLRARLVVAADGADSAIRAAALIGAETIDYQQSALIARLSTERPAEAVAYERFSAAGPLALLPLPGGEFGLVWSCARADASRLLALDDAAFIRELQPLIGWRTGAVRRVGRRGSYELRLLRAAQLVAARVALLGNAGQALHPIAGQGFNLGLRDAAVLADVLAAAEDPGSAATLEIYQRQREGDRQGMIEFTDGLVRSFASAHPALGLLRALALCAFDYLPGAQQRLSRLSWGFAARAPRLMRGLRASAAKRSALAW